MISIIEVEVLQFFAAR